MKTVTLTLSVADAYAVQAAIEMQIAHYARCIRMRGTKTARGLFRELQREAERLHDVVGVALADVHAPDESDDKTLTNIPVGERIRANVVLRSNGDHIVNTQRLDRDGNIARDWSRVTRGTMSWENAVRAAKQYLTGETP